MTVGTWLKRSCQELEQAGIGTARLDALVLLEEITGRDRSWLLANPKHELKPGEQAKLAKLLKQRAEHMPLAYVRGTTEFYGRNFVITPAVLEPRPESETMIDLLGELLKDDSLPRKKIDNAQKPLKIADVGTGSGALGITAILEFSKGRKLTVDLLEIDKKALKVAKINVEKHTTTISVIESDLLAGSSMDYDVLLCNLPYVPDTYIVNEAAAREPKIAIFGGPDGLDIYRKLFEQLDNLKKRPLYILTESLPPQHEALTAIARQHNYKLEKSEDFIQVFRAKTPAA